MRRLLPGIAAVVLLSACTTLRPIPTSSVLGTPTNEHCAAVRSTSRTDQPPVEPVDVPVVGARLRILALGDFGDGSLNQQAVANAMNDYLARNPGDRASFGLTLGDNFYKEGLQGRSIPWNDLWESKYARLGLLFFASLGNHDYSDATPEQELEYSSQSWCLPQHYYTFTAGTAQFFALDTQRLVSRRGDAQQLQWLDLALERSRARWKIIYGHHPILSNGDHGDDSEITRLRDRLLPKLRGRATIYLTGHDHDLQRLAAEGVPLFVAGAGGHEVRPLRVTPSADEWGVGMTLGFAVLEMTEEQLVVQLLNKDQTPLCTFRIDQSGSFDDTGCRQR